MIETRKLPDTLSGLLEAALEDAAKLTKLRPRKYLPQSDSWVRTSARGVCKFCLAGAVMLRLAGRKPPSLVQEMKLWLTGRESPDLGLVPACFIQETNDKLRAIDYMRVGAWVKAWKHIYFYRIPDWYPQDGLWGKLDRLPMPLDDGFVGWDALERHLYSLRSILPKLREIEEEYL